jgi:hypothetical protein
MNPTRFAIGKFFDFKNKLARFINEKKNIILRRKAADL